VPHCSCAFGEEARCGLPSPLAPAAPGCRAGQPPGGYALETLPFENVARGALRLDPSAARRPRQVPNASISRCLPTPLRAAALRTVAVDPAVAAALGLAAAEVRLGGSPNELLARNEPPNLFRISL
jgi:hypothetical protein